MPQFAIVTIHESDLAESDREFLDAWAKNLNVSVEELLKRILLEAIKGGHYIDGIP